VKKVLILVGLLLIIIFLIIRPKYIKDLRLAEKTLASYVPSVTTTPIVSVQYYREGKGYPIIIAHGITGGFDQGLGLAKNYVGEGYDFIAVSRFGYLGSELPVDSSPDAQADVYKYLLDKLNIEKAFVFGNSAGGTSAIKFAMKYPDRCLGLILVSSNVPTKVSMPPKPVMKAFFGSDFLYWGLSSLMKENMLKMIGVTKSIQEGMTKEEKDKLLNEIIISGLPISLRTKGVINDMFVSNPDINDNYCYEQIKIPTLIIHAKDDTLCSFNEAFAISKRVNNAEFVSFEQGGHLILNHEDEIKNKIANFIKSLDSN
jgi:pimeloyl-ACP methyl ester carboxylesterase